MDTNGLPTHYITNKINSFLFFLSLLFFLSHLFSVRVRSACDGRCDKNNAWIYSGKRQILKCLWYVILTCAPCSDTFWSWDPENEYWYAWGSFQRPVGFIVSLFPYSVAPGSSVCVEPRARDRKTGARSTRDKFFDMFCFF